MREFMLKMLEERAVCIFDVVDQEKEPTLFYTPGRWTERPDM